MKPIKHAFLVAAATLALTGPLAAQANDVSVSHECEQGEAQALPGYVLYETFMTVLRARAACNEGRVADGLALYDGIIQPVLAQKKQ